MPEFATLYLFELSFHNFQCYYHLPTLNTSHVLSPNLTLNIPMKNIQPSPSLEKIVLRERDLPKAVQLRLLSVVRIKLDCLAHSLILGKYSQ